MYRRIAQTSTVVLISALSGCSVAGKWNLSDVNPTAAQRDARFRSFTLDKDGLFYADATEPTGIRTTSGTYCIKMICAISVSTTGNERLMTRNSTERPCG